MERLAGKHILVTAAAQGIGRATVEAAAEEGAFVIATDVNEQLLIELEAIENVTARKLDVLDPDAIATVAREVGALDGLVNVAPALHSEPTSVFFVYPTELRRSKRVAVFRDFVLDELDREGLLAG